MFENYDRNIKFKDVRIGQTFIANGTMFIKMHTADRNDRYNAKQVKTDLKRYDEFKPDDIVAVVGSDVGDRKFR
jgi:hypothetical protein